jgi:hypothetical protein
MAGRRLAAAVRFSFDCLRERPVLVKPPFFSLAPCPRLRHCLLWEVASLWVFTAHFSFLLHKFRIVYLLPWYPLWVLGAGAFLGF